MWREAQQPPALAARLEHQVEIPVLEISQPTMYEARRAARRTAREIILFYEGDAHSTQRSIARDAAARDAAADNEDVEFVARERDKLRTALLDWRVVALGGGCQIVLFESAAERAIASLRSLSRPSDS